MYRHYIKYSKILLLEKSIMARTKLCNILIQAINTAMRLARDMRACSFRRIT